MNDNENNTYNVNEGYLKEMETNNYLFNEKIKKLNNLLINANKNNDKKVNRENFDNHNIEKYVLNNSDSENDLNNKENERLAEEIMKNNNFNNRDSEIDFKKNKNIYKEKDLNLGFEREIINDKKIQNKTFNNFKEFKKDHEEVNNNNNNLLIKLKFIYIWKTANMIE